MMMVILFDVDCWENLIILRLKTIWERSLNERSIQIKNVKIVTKIIIFMK